MLYIPFTLNSVVGRIFVGYKQMGKGKIHIGTSGWSYKDWKEIYYPPKMKATDWISFYAKDFKATEINASFYRLPTQETVLKWIDKVPRGFKFCPKMSRYLTHVKKLRGPEEPLQRFFSIFEPMKKHMGPVLIQLPPQLKFNTEVVEHLYKLLRNEYKEYRFALEARHPTWVEKESFDMMRKYHIAFVISQSGVGWPYEEVITAKDVYVRFHGPGNLYASKYTDEMLQEYAGKFNGWMNDGHSIWVFFNNDWYANAVYNAKTLIEMTK